MALSSDRWKDSIDEAVEELDTGRQTSKKTHSFSLPSWIAYPTLLVLGFFIINGLLADKPAHPVNAERSYYSGGKVALLIAAEDIEHYRNQNGDLPDSLPEAIPRTLNIDYEITDKTHFRLTMYSHGSTIIFDESSRKLSLETL
jgi:hypothetical protein